MGDIHRLIAFDLDGTLIDSRRDLADSANDLIMELGGRPLQESAIAAMVGEGARVLVGRALTRAGLEEVDLAQALPRFLEIYDTRLLRHTRPYEGIAVGVRHARAHARLIVLTNKPLEPSEKILAALGLRDLFDEVIGGDGAWPRKPDPSGLQAAIARAGSSASRTLLIGDSAIDRDTAARASAQFCFAAYGFGCRPGDAVVGSDTWRVETPGDLPNVIDRFIEV